MTSESTGWTAEEQELARAVFERAQARELEALILTLRTRSAALQTPEDIWQLHDFLSIRRHGIEGREAFQLAGLLFVFAAFVKDGLVDLEEFAGLSADKRAKIGAMVRI
jgi:hypothetical protein